MNDAPRWQALHDALARHGLHWSFLLESAEQVILFGSRAAGVERADSDFDLLCVGSGRQVKHRELDVLWVEAARLRSRDWLGSELAGHVAHHGVWLQGEPDWVDSIWRSRAALDAKREFLQCRLRAVEERMDRLAPAYQRKYQRLLRRDLQRYECLSQGVSVPPTALLDRAWEKAQEPMEKLLEWSSIASLPHAPLMRLMKPSLAR